MVVLHPTVKKLLAEIEAYCARSGTHITNFGIQATNDGHLVRRLQAGRMPTLKTVDRVRAFIASKTKAVQSK